MKERTSGTTTQAQSRRFQNECRQTSRLAAQLFLTVILGVTAVTAQSDRQPAQASAAAADRRPHWRLNERYQTAPAAAKGRLLAQMQALAARRQQLLLHLMDTDPCRHAADVAL